MVRLSIRLVMTVRSARASSAHSATERTLWPTSRPMSHSRVRKCSMESRKISWSALSSRISRAISASSLQLNCSQAFCRMLSTNQARSSISRRMSRPLRKRSSSTSRAWRIAFLKAAIGLAFSASSAWNWPRSKSSGSTWGIVRLSFLAISQSQHSLGKPGQPLRRNAWDRVVRAQGEDFVAGVGDQQGVFPLCGELAVLGDGGPAVAQYLGVSLALVDHRLDGEGHAGFQFHARTGAAVVQDLRLFVEHLADAVAAELANHREAVLFSVLLDHFTDIAQAAAGFDDFNGLVHAFLGHLGQALGPDRHSADVEHAAGITVVAVFDDRDVDVQGVAVFQRLVARNPVADHVVDRGADRLGEALVVQRGRDSLLHVDYIVVADAVQCFGGDAGLDVFGNHFQHVGRQFAGNAHASDVFGGFQGNSHTGSL